MFVEGESAVDDSIRRSTLISLKNTILRAQGLLHTQPPMPVPVPVPSTAASAAAYARIPVTADTGCDLGSAFLTGVEKVRSLYLL